MDHVSLPIAVAADLAMAVGLAVAWLFYIRRPDIRPSSPASSGCSTGSCSTSGTSTRSTTSSSSGRCCGSGALLWKGGDGWLIDGFGPDGVSAGCRRHPQRGAAADRLPVPLRLRDADRRRRLHHLVHVLGGRPLMASWPILSVTTFLPLLGALLIILMRGDDRSGRPNAQLDRVVDDADYVRDLADPGVALRSELGRIPVRRDASPGSPAPSATTWASTASRCHSSFSPLRDADLHHRELAADPAPGEGIHDRLPGARDPDGRHLLRRSTSPCSTCSSKAA